MKKYFAMVLFLIGFLSLNASEEIKQLAKKINGQKLKELTLELIRSTKFEGSENSYQKIKPKLLKKISKQLHSSKNSLQNNKIYIKRCFNSLIILTCLWKLEANAFCLGSKENAVLHLIEQNQKILECYKKKALTILHNPLALEPARFILEQSNNQKLRAYALCFLLANTPEKQSLITLIKNDTQFCSNLLAEDKQEIIIHLKTLFSNKIWNNCTNILCYRDLVLYFVNKQWEQAYSLAQYVAHIWGKSLLHCSLSYDLYQELLITNYHLGWNSAVKFASSNQQIIQSSQNCYKIFEKLINKNYTPAIIVACQLFGTPKPPISLIARASNHNKKILIKEPDKHFRLSQNIRSQLIQKKLLPKNLLVKARQEQRKRSR